MSIPHPPVGVFDMDDDDPDDDQISARTFVEWYRGGAWACYDPDERVVEVVSVRDDAEYRDDLLPRMLSHEFLHHLLHVYVDGPAYRELDNIDAGAALCQ